ncbi:MAG: TolC family protein [Verrucomicrobiota bacterium]
MEFGKQVGNFWLIVAAINSIHFAVHGQVDTKIDTYTLIDCLNTALEKNTNIRVSKQDLEEVKGLEIEARAVLYPRLDLGANLQMENEDLFEDEEIDRTAEEDPGFQEEWSVNLTLSHSIYSGGINRNQVAIAELEKEVAFIEFQEIINTELFLVKEAFYEVLLYSEEAKIQSDIIDLLSQEVVKQKRLFDAGRASKFDIVRTEVRLANEKPSFIEARTKLQIAAIDLAEAMGLRWVGGTDQLPLKVQGQLFCPELAYSLDELIERALSKRPEPLRFSKEIEIERRSAKIARASNIPRINAFVRGSLERDTSQEERTDPTQSDNQSFTDSQTEFSFGLLGVWNIFDGFRGKGAAEAAEARQRAAQIQLDDANRVIEFDVRRAYLRLRRAEGLVASQSGNVDKAREALDLVNKSLEAGRNDLFDVLQTTVDLNRALTTELRAKFAYHQALAELEQATFTRRLKVSNQSIIKQKEITPSEQTQ